MCRAFFNVNKFLQRQRDMRCKRDSFFFLFIYIKNIKNLVKLQFLNVIFINRSILFEITKSYFE